MSIVHLVDRLLRLLLGEFLCFALGSFDLFLPTFFHGALRDSSLLHTVVLRDLGVAETDAEAQIERVRVGREFARGHDALRSAATSAYVWPVDSSVAFLPVAP